MSVLDRVHGFFSSVRNLGESRPARINRVAALDVVRKVPGSTGVVDVSHPDAVTWYLAMNAITRSCRLKGKAALQAAVTVPKPREHQLERIFVGNHAFLERQAIKLCVVAQLALIGAPRPPV